MIAFKIDDCRIILNHIVTYEIVVNHIKIDMIDKRTLYINYDEKIISFLDKYFTLEEL